MSRALTNFIAFQIGWFSCVIGAANGYPLLGPIVVLAVIALHLRLSDKARAELLLVVAAAAMGAVFDSALARTGWVTYPNGVLIAGTAPYWIVAMWALFATTLNVSMRWLHNRPVAAVVLGATGGPLSYLAGERLGGLVFNDPTAALIYLAIGWGIVTPVLVMLGQRLENSTSNDRAFSQHA